LFWKIIGVKRSSFLKSYGVGLGLVSLLVHPSVAQVTGPNTLAQLTEQSHQYDMPAQNSWPKELVFHPSLSLDITSGFTWPNADPELMRSKIDWGQPPQEGNQPLPASLLLSAVEGSIIQSRAPIRTHADIEAKADPVYKQVQAVPDAVFQAESYPLDMVSSSVLAQEEAPPALPEVDPELGIIRVRNTAEDPELGILRIREQPVIPAATPQAAPEIGFFTTRLSFASSDNVLLAVNDVGGLTGDEFIRPGVSLAFYPPVGPQTFLIGNVDVGLQRYTTQSDLNYDDLRFRLGVRQGLFPRTYGQLLFTYQQLFRPGSPRFRFFENTAFSFTLGRRDPLTDQLTLNSYYQVQLNDAESRATADGPTNLTQFDRVTQSLGGYLNYAITPQWRTGISYQLTLSDYTGQERYDTYHQVLGQLIYRITPDVRMSLYGGWSFGRSSEPRIRFDDTFFGISVDATVTLF
jgi:hypothetical protein